MLRAGVPHAEEPAPIVEGAPNDPPVVDGKVTVDPKLGAAANPADFPFCCPKAANGEALLASPVP